MAETLVLWGERHSRFPGLTEFTLVLLSAGLLAFYSGAWIIRDVIFGVSPAPLEALRFVGMPLALLGGCFVLMRPFAALRLGLDSLALLLLVLWAALSVLWSVDAAATLQRVIAVLAALLAAVGLVVRFDALSLVRITTAATGIGTGLSLLLYLAGDPLAVSEIGVRGAFAHKNVLGQVTAIQLVLGFCLLQQRGGDRALGLASLALGLPCLVLAQSATAIAATAVGAGALILLQVLASARLPAFAKPAVLLGAVLAGAVALVSADALLGLLGRDYTFTGRNLIWEFTLDRWAERPWQGYGFRAFWTAAYNAGELQANFYSRYDHAHSGYLQVLLDLGLIGLGLLLAWIALVSLHAARNLDLPGVPAWAALWAALILYSMSEAIFLAPNGFTWFALTLGGLCVTRAGAGRVRGGEGPQRFGKSEMAA